MGFDSNCIVGSVKNPNVEPGTVTISTEVLSTMSPANSWRALAAYKNAAKVCGVSPHRAPMGVDRDVAGTRLSGISFRGALQP